MSLKSVHEKLLKIKRESSTNSKVQLLSEYLKEFNLTPDYKKG